MERFYQMTLVNSQGRFEKKGVLDDLIKEAEHMGNIFSLEIRREVIGNGKETVQKEEKASES